MAFYTNVFKARLGQGIKNPYNVSFSMLFPNASSGNPAQVSVLLGKSLIIPLYDHMITLNYQN
jgi:hypothetical protein